MCFVYGWGRPPGTGFSVDPLLFGCGSSCFGTAFACAVCHLWRCQVSIDFPVSYPLLPSSLLGQTESPETYKRSGAPSGVTCVYFSECAPLILASARHLSGSYWCHCCSSRHRSNSTGEASCAGRTHAKRDIRETGMDKPGRVHRVFPPEPRDRCHSRAHHLPNEIAEIRMSLQGFMWDKPLEECQTSPSRIPLPRDQVPRLWL